MSAGRGRIRRFQSAVLNFLPARYLKNKYFEDINRWLQGRCVQCHNNDDNLNNNNCYYRSKKGKTKKKKSFNHFIEIPGARRAARGAGVLPRNRSPRTDTPPHAITENKHRENHTSVTVIITITIMLLSRARVTFYQTRMSTVGVLHTRSQRRRRRVWLQLACCGLIAPQSVSPDSPVSLLPCQINVTVTPSRSHRSPNTFRTMSNAARRTGFAYFFFFANKI